MPSCCLSWAPHPDLHTKSQRMPIQPDLYTKSQITPIQPDLHRECLFSLICTPRVRECLFSLICTPSSRECTFYMFERHKDANITKYAEVTSMSMRKIRLRTGVVQACHECTCIRLYRAHLCLTSYIFLCISR
jgi:hypothetical protein